MRVKVNKEAQGYISTIFYNPLKIKVKAKFYITN